MASDVPVSLQISELLAKLAIGDRTKKLTHQMTKPGKEKLRRKTPEGKKGTQASKWRNFPVNSGINDVSNKKETSLTQSDVDPPRIESYGDVHFEREPKPRVVWRKRRALSATAEAALQREARRRAFMRYQRLRQKWVQQQQQEQLQQQRQKSNVEQDAVTVQRLLDHRQPHNGQEQEESNQKVSHKQPTRSSTQVRRTLSTKDRLELWRLIHQRRRAQHASGQEKSKLSQDRHSGEADQSNTQEHTARHHSFDESRHDRSFSGRSSSVSPSHLHEDTTLSSLPHAVRQEISRGQDISVSPSKSRPAYRSLERGKQGFMSEVTTVYPFIPTTRALDYLTRYDSRTPPRRWPVKMILPPSESLEQDSEIVATHQKQNLNVSSHSENEQFPQLPAPGQHHSSKNRDPKIIRSDLDTDDIDDEENTSFEPQEGSGSQSREIGDTNPDAESRSQISAKDRSARKKHDKGKRKATKHFDGDDNDVNESKEERRRRRRLLKRLRRQKRKERRRRRRKNMAIEVTTTPGIVAVDRTSNPSDLTNPQPASLSGAHSQPSFGNGDRQEINGRLDPSSVVSVYRDQMQVDNHHLLTTYDRSRENEETGSALKRFDRKRKNKQNALAAKHIREDKADAGIKDNLAHSRGVLSPEDVTARKTDFKTADPVQHHDHRRNKDGSYVTHSQSPAHASLSLKSDVNARPYFVQVNGAKEHTETTGSKAWLQHPLYDTADGRSSKTSDKVRSSNTPDEGSLEHAYSRTHSGPKSEGKSSGLDRRWSASQEYWDNTNTSKLGNSSITESSLPQDNTFSRSSLNGRSRPSLKENFKNSTAALNPSHPSKSAHTPQKSTHTPQKSTHTPQISPRRQSASSAAKRWRDRLKKKKAKESSDKSKNRKRKNNADKNPRRGSVALKLGKSTNELSESQSETDTSLLKASSSEETENGPFIGHKTAYDFLSSQKGIKKTTTQSEKRREANELNRFMSEGMCEIFNKHYVPTLIGGKCI